MMHSKETSVIQRVKNAYPKSNHDDTSHTPNLRDILQNKLLVFFKNVNIKGKKHLGMVQFQIQENKKTKET